jgi:dTDP-3-amino-2,3,6-trideoxy-4-keto-D-glucose/dTDP-3-amino-3,4,6-trideoxy-alpha-D-glucose/dTDP-2,6-dideoxy-D-kanosamine transaminase
MKIKVWDYLNEYKAEKKEIEQAIEDVLTSGSLILGDKVKSFEEAFSTWCGVNYGVGVDNGTDALFLGLKALNIGAGDEVITVANTAVPTVSAITATGAKAVFVDIDPSSFLIDADKIEKVITSKTKCILPVHLFGQCADMKRIDEIARKNNLLVLEDCAQSHGAEFEGKKAGSMSDLAAFSFYPTKILGGFGDGGMVVTRKQELSERLRRLRFYGMEKTYYSLEQGYNSRLDELHASILLKKLNHLDDYIARRRCLAGQYDRQLINSSLILPKEVKGRKHAYYLYVVRHPQRQIIIEELKKRDIFVNISYPWPIHTMKGFSDLGYKNGDLPITEKLANEIFSLPMYPSLTDNEQNVVIHSLLDILNTI